MGLCDGVMISITVVDAGFALVHALLVLGVGIGQLTDLDSLLDLLSGLAVVCGLLVLVLLFTVLTNVLFGHSSFWRAGAVSDQRREGMAALRQEALQAHARASATGAARRSAGPTRPPKYMHGERRWPARFSADTCLGVFEYLTLTDLASMETTSRGQARAVQDSLVWHFWANRVFRSVAGRTGPRQVGGQVLDRRVLFAKDPRSQLCLRRSVTRAVKLRGHALAASHTTPEDVWVVVRGQALDVSRFLQRHPGGAQILIEYAGRDATRVFDLAMHSSAALSLLQEFVVFDPQRWLGRRLKGYYLSGTVAPSWPCVAAPPAAAKQVHDQPEPPPTELWRARLSPSTDGDVE